MKWMRIQDVMERIAFSNNACRRMVKELRRGLEVRIAERAGIYTKLTEAEAREVMLFGHCRALDVLAAAARESTEWEDASALPQPIEKRYGFEGWWSKNTYQSLKTIWSDVRIASIDGNKYLNVWDADDIMLKTRPRAAPDLGIQITVAGVVTQTGSKE